MCVDALGLTVIFFWFFFCCFVLFCFVLFCFVLFCFGGGGVIISIPLCFTNS